MSERASTPGSGIAEAQSQQGGEVARHHHPTSRVERRAMRRPEGDAALTKRSIFTGLLLVTFVAAFTPYNDYILQNSPFIGNHFPIGIVTLMAVLILAVNPLFSMIGKRPFGQGELVVVMTMMLIGAAAPSSGLMRYLEPMVVSPYWLIQDHPWLKNISAMMPSWLVPTTDPNSPLVSSYRHGIDALHGGRIPIVQFLLPQFLWGILIAAIFGAAMFLSAIFRKQWVHHERLTYPLATIPLELMASPEEGRWFNKLWRNPLLWVGASIPILVYLLEGLHQHYPAVPVIDLKYDIHSAFVTSPWDALPAHVSTNVRLYLAVVGICFFIPSEIAFSLWLFLVVNAFSRVLFARTSIDPGLHEDQRSMGVYVLYFAGLLWLARGHLKYVLVAAWRNSERAENEPLKYRTMVIGWVVCMAVAWVWLMMVGMNPFAAMLLLGLGTMLVTLMSRVVAETGLFFVGPAWWPRDFVNALLGPKWVNTASLYWTQITSRIFFADLRETLMPYAANSMRMGQEVAAPQRSRWFGWLCIALFLSVLVSGGMHHYLSYSKGRTVIDDPYATEQMPFDAMQETFRSSLPSQTDYKANWGHFTLGGAMVSVLMVGRMMFVSWPFHPIGLVMMSVWPLKVFWFSIFVGWGVKRLLLRYGGAGAFRRARPFFIGLIVGETLSAGIWMFVGLATHGAVRYTLLPG